MSTHTGELCVCVCVCVCLCMCVRVWIVCSHREMVTMCCRKKWQTVMTISVQT